MKRVIWNIILDQLSERDEAEARAEDYDFAVSCIASDIDDLVQDIATDLKQKRGGNNE